MKPRLLYLGFALPPGMQRRYPALNTAGHDFETGMVTALRPFFEVRSVGLLPFSPPEHLEAAASPGLPHALVLLDKAPEVWWRWRSLSQLKQTYRAWTRDGWEPEAVLVYNLSPVYSGFIHWLSRQPRRPRLFVLFADSSTLGRPQRWLKRLRYRFKPMVYDETATLRRFDAAVALSRDTAWFWEQHRLPWLWMPGGCNPSEAAVVGEEPTAPEIQFGYFGSLAAYSGVLPLVETFARTPVAACLHVCGHGRLGAVVQEHAQAGARVRFHGTLDSAEECLRVAQGWDVLVNPRPAAWGNENNFPSKVFRYALAGRAILTTRMSGVDAVLGEEAYYFEGEDIPGSLPPWIERLAGCSRAELRRRGAALRQRMIDHYAWAIQGGRMAEFMQRAIVDARKQGGAVPAPRSVQPANGPP